MCVQWNAIGLAASCETLLLSEMSVVSVKPIIILNTDNGLMYNNTLYVITNDRSANNKSSTTSSSSNTSSTSTMAPVTATTTGNESTNASVVKSKSSNHHPIIYKFFTPRYVDVVRLRFNVMRACDQCQPIEIRVQANALPTPKHNIHSVVISTNKTSENIFDFYPNQNTWHYIEIKFLNCSNDGNDSDASVSLNATPMMGISRAFKSKARLDKRTQFMENNIFVNFSIGLEFINEMPVVVESTENGSSNELNKSTTNVNSNNRGDSQNGSNHNNSSNGKTGSANVNRSMVNTSNSDSSSLFDQNPSKSKTTTTTSPTAIRSTIIDESNDSEYLDSDEIDLNDDANASSANQSAKPRKINYYSLLRQTYREFFMFDYDLQPDENGTVPTFINLTAGTPTGFRFQVGNVFDIGGTLSFAIVMKDNLHDASLAAAASAASMVKERNRISNDVGVAVAEKLVHINNEEMNDAPSHELGEGKVSSGTSSSNVKTIDLNQSHENDDAGYDNSSGSNQTIIICMHLNAAALPKWPNQCVYGGHVFDAAAIMNNTNEDTSTGLVHVPFPEPGTWYITLGLFCHGAETSRITIIDSVKEFIKKYVDLLHDVRVPCACANRTDYYQKCVTDARCLNDLSESETLKVKECLMDSKCTNKHKEMARKFELHHRYATEQSVATDSNTCNASAVFTISSSPCVAGRCGKFGRCYHYM